MNTHTPGPWHIEQVAAGRNVIKGIRKDGKTVSVITADSWVAEPDAKLIAAAPDLLEALQGILKTIDIMRPDDFDPDKSNTVLAARSALAKATGS